VAAAAAQCGPDRVEAAPRGAVPMESPAPDPDDVWPQIRSALERLQRPFPHAAVALALQHREAVAPHLLTALEANNLVTQAEESLETA